MADQSVSATNNLSTEELAATIVSYIRKYFSYDSGTSTVTFEFATLVENLRPKVAELRTITTQLVTKTYDGYVDSDGEVYTAATIFISAIDDVTTDLLGVTIEDFFKTAVEGMDDESVHSAVQSIAATLITMWRVQDDTDPFENLVQRVNSLDNDNTLTDAFEKHLVAPFLEKRGIQTVSNLIAKTVVGTGELNLMAGLDLLPGVFQMFNDTAVAVVQSVLDSVLGDLRADLTAGGNNDEPNHVTVTINGVNGAKKYLSLYSTDPDAVGSATMPAIDASNAELTAFKNAVIANIDGTAGESILGSAEADIILAGAGDSVNSGAGADLVIFADGNSTIFSKDVDGNDIEAQGTLYSAVTGTYFEDNHNRQFVALSDESSVRVLGFDVGWSIDGGETDAIYVIGGDRSEYLFEFTDEGLDIRSGNGRMVIAKNDAAALADNPNFGDFSETITTTTRTLTSTVSADFLINIDNELVTATATNATQSIEANGAQQYFLGADSTLTGFTGSAVINDMKITTNATLDITVRQRTDGFRVVSHIYGVKAGDSLESAMPDGSDGLTYVVNEAGTSIIRSDNGREVWSGTAEELNELDFLTIDYQNAA